METFAETNNIVYVLMIVGWVVYSFYKASKKKAAKKQKQQTANQADMPITAPTPQKPNSIFETLMQELNTDNKTTSFETNTVAENDNFLPGEGNYKPTLSQQKTKQKTKPKTEENTTITITEEDEKSFDLKQAVIYAEILNRPYK